MAQNATQRTFRHPGVIVDQGALSSLGSRVRQHPDASVAWQSFLQSPYANLARPHTPTAVVRVISSTFYPEQEAFRGDAQAAYAMALRWVATGRAEFRDKALAILNGWAAAFDRLQDSPANQHPNGIQQSWLEAAWFTPIWAAAGEILRHHRGGIVNWPATEVAQFDSFLTKLANTARPAVDFQNNWGSSANLALMAVAVFQEDAVTYEAARQRFEQQIRTMTQSNGAIIPDYLRNPTTPQNMLLGWIQTAETARIQGDDLYGYTVPGQSLPRLALVAEHFSQLFTGVLPNPGLASGDYRGAHLARQGYEIVFSHYIRRRNLAAQMPNLAAMVPAWRPGGLDLRFVGWDAATHGGLDQPGFARLHGDHLVATDALGRTLPEFASAGPVRSGKLVGVFYYLWNGAHGDRVYDIAQIIRQPSGSRTWGPVDSFHFWGEPEYGYYRSDDPWVLRRDLIMLTQAKVDFLYFDTTNAVTYLNVVRALCEVSRQLRAEGFQTPDIVFTTNAASGRTMNRIYDEFYALNQYPDLWFRWQGKPLIFGNINDAELRPEVRDFFTIRRSWVGSTNPAQMQNQWPWLNSTPQTWGWSGQPDNREQVAVAVAFHPENPRGQSWTVATGQLPVNAAYTTNATGRGLHAQEQWNRALQVDPQVIMVTQWNEWLAQRRLWDKGPGQYAGRPIADGDSYFIDVFSQEFNRDMAPMKGGHTDNMYYQMIANIRRYKGMEAPPTSSTPRTITPGNPAQWNTVAPIFWDAEDTAPRNFASYDPRVTLINTTGRNDIVQARVTHDRQNVYFQARTAQNITAPEGSNWMLLYLNTDRNASTGWMGYDFLINQAVGDAGATTVQRWDGTRWISHGTVPMEISGTSLQVTVPRTLLGLTAEPVQFHFKWADNVQAPTNIESFFTTGDVAPDRRFNYAYQNQGAPLDTGLSRIADQQIAVNGSSGSIPLTLDAGALNTANVTFTVTSTDDALLPAGAVTVQGVGTARAVMITPAWGHVGSAFVTIRAWDGTRESLTTFFLEVLPPSAPLAYGFDAGALQGWTTVGADPTNRQFFAIVPPSRSSPFTTPQAGSGLLGLHIPAFGGTPAYTQDSAHGTLWMRSPSFRLVRGQAISAWLVGGGAGSTDLAGTRAADVPSASVVGGFRGLALRDALTGNFVLTARRTANGTAWEQVGFTAAQLDALPEHRVYTLDLIDVGQGAWGWTSLDSVSIPGVLAEPLSGEVPVLTIEPWANDQIRLVWPSTFREWRLQRSENLTSGFVDANLPVIEQGGRNYVLDAMSPTRRFYRLRR